MIRHALESIVFLFVILGVLWLLSTAPVQRLLRVLWYRGNDVVESRRNRGSTPVPQPQSQPAASSQPVQSVSVPASQPVAASAVPMPTGTAGASLPSNSDYIGSFLDEVVASYGYAAPNHQPSEETLKRQWVHETSAKYRRIDLLREIAAAMPAFDATEQKSRQAVWLGRWKEIGGRAEEHHWEAYKELCDLHWTIMRAKREEAHLDRLRSQQAHYQQAAADRRKRSAYHNRQNIMRGGSAGHFLGAGQQAQRAREFEDKAARLSAEIDSRSSPVFTIDAARQRMREIVDSL